MKTETKVNDLTRDEVKEALSKGKKLTHIYFTDFKWIIMMGDLILFEDGQTQSSEEFWKFKTGKTWDSGWNIIDDRRYKSLDDMESRMQILDRCAKKFGSYNFEDFCLYYGGDSIIQLVYHAMNEHSVQERSRTKFKLEEEYTDQKIEDMMIDTMKEKWTHCFMDGKLCQRPKNFEDELQYKIEGAKLLLNKII